MKYRVNEKKNILQQDKYRSNEKKSINLTMRKSAPSKTAFILTSKSIGKVIPK